MATDSADKNVTHAANLIQMSQRLDGLERSLDAQLTETNNGIAEMDELFRSTRKLFYRITSKLKPMDQLGSMQNHTT